jgi:hypothetical protein
VPKQDVSKACGSQFDLVFFSFSEFCFFFCFYIISLIAACFLASDAVVVDV